MGRIKNIIKSKLITPLRRIGFILQIGSIFTFLFAILYWFSGAKYNLGYTYQGKYYSHWQYRDFFDTDYIWGIMLYISIAGFIIGTFLFLGYAERIINWIKTGK